jgi:hypothetical protein
LQIFVPYGKPATGNVWSDTAARGPLQFRRQLGPRRRGLGNLEEADLAIGGGDPETAMLELDVGLAGFEQMAGR